MVKFDTNVTVKVGKKMRWKATGFIIVNIAIVITDVLHCMKKNNSVVKHKHFNSDRIPIFLMEWEAH